MEDQLISFETAKLARDKGFLEYVDNEYAMNGELRFDRSGIHYYVVKRANDSISIASAPTQSLLQRWLREVYKIQIVVHPILVEKAKSPIKYDWYILYDVNKDAIESKNLPLHTYETALEIALQEALKLIK